MIPPSREGNGVQRGWCQDPHRDAHPTPDSLAAGPGGSAGAEFRPIQPGSRGAHGSPTLRESGPDRVGRCLPGAPRSALAVSPRARVAPGVAPGLARRRRPGPSARSGLRTRVPPGGAASHGRTAGTWGRLGTPQKLHADPRPRAVRPPLSPDSEYAQRERAPPRPRPRPRSRARALTWGLAALPAASRTCRPGAGIRGGGAGPAAPGTALSAGRGPAGHPGRSDTRSGAAGARVRRGGGGSCAGGDGRRPAPRATGPGSR